MWVVYMAWDVMILMEANLFRGPLDGWALKIKTFLGPEITRNECGVSREMMEVEYAIARVKEVQPFSGMHFFSVEWSTLTAMFSTTITYLIILVQTPTPGKPHFYQRYLQHYKTICPHFK
jgi:hypothetical protein